MSMLERDVALVRECLADSWCEMRDADEAVTRIVQAMRYLASQPGGRCSDDSYYCARMGDYTACMCMDGRSCDHCETPNRGVLSDDEVDARIVDAYNQLGRDKR